MNTTITYLYRDAANYKAYKTITVEGVIRFDDIYDYLEDGEDFIPYDVGLEELQSTLRGFPSDDDQVWHTLQPDNFEWGTMTETEDVTAKQLIRRFKAAHKRCWQIRAAMKRLGIK